MLKLQLDTSLFAVCAAVLLVASCSGGDFKAGGRKGAAEKTGASQQDNDETRKSDDSIDAKDSELTEKPSDGDSAAIAKCLAKWGDHPFGAQPVHRKIHAAVQVFGHGKGIVDDVKTTVPALILIGAAVNVLGETTYELLNPNGWYCLKVDVNVKAKTQIDLHCDAKLADSKVDVSVGSQSQPVGIVGVHVLSDVKIARVGGSCE